jgi:hypothetical protein
MRQLNFNVTPLCKIKATMLGSYRREESANALPGREESTTMWWSLAARLEGKNRLISFVVAGKRTKKWGEARVACGKASSKTAWLGMGCSGGASSSLSGWGGGPRKGRSFGLA